MCAALLFDCREKRGEGVVERQPAGDRAAPGGCTLGCCEARGRGEVLRLAPGVCALGIGQGPRGSGEALRLVLAECPLTRRCGEPLPSVPGAGERGLGPPPAPSRGAATTSLTLVAVLAQEGTCAQLASLSEEKPAPQLDGCPGEGPPADGSWLVTDGWGSQQMPSASCPGRDWAVTTARGGQAAAASGCTCRTARERLKAWPRFVEFQESLRLLPSRSMCLLTRARRGPFSSTMFMWRQAHHRVAKQSAATRRPAAMPMITGVGMPGCAAPPATACTEPAAPDAQSAAEVEYRNTCGVVPEPPVSEEPEGIVAAGVVGGIVAAVKEPALANVVLTTVPPGNGVAVVSFCTDAPVPIHGGRMTCKNSVLMLSLRWIAQPEALTA